MYKTDSENDTKKNVISNLFWRFAERTGAQIVSFLVTIILARLLDPSIYGTIALISVFITILQVFVDSGLGNALIQKKNVDNIDFSTVFYTNIIFCSFLYLLLFLISPYIARFYDDPDISKFMRVIGITVLISGIKNVQQAYVSRYMLFRKFFYSTLGGTITAGIVAIMMAYKGFGIWALIMNHILNLTIDTIILWITVGWYPQISFSMNRLKGLFSYGWKLLLSSLLEVVYTNLSSLIIGKRYSSSELAYYNQGNKFPIVIVSNINSSIDSVLLPTMSRKQDDKENIKKMTRISLITCLYLMAPLMVGLATCGESIVTLVLTEKWLPSVFFMRIFCVIYIFYPINTVNLNAMKALGRSDIFLVLEAIKKIVGLAILVITMFISVKAIAVGLLISSIICQVVNATPNRKLINYGYTEQIKDMMPVLLSVMVMGIVIYPIKYLQFSNIVTLSIQIPLGAFVYYFISRIFHLEAYEYILNIVKQLLKKGRN